MAFLKTIPAEIKRNVSRQQIRRKIRQANSDGAMLDGFAMRPGYIYTVVRAITARVNQNWDGWPSDELKTSYKTFVGKPVFVNHQNSDPAKARGRVVAARYFENGADKGVECVMEVDAQRFPKLAHELRTGGLDSVSMGAEAGFTICSMCGNKATDTHDMCDHVRFHKGEYLLKKGQKDPQLVYETCHKLGFFELSYVFEPADETAVVSKVIQAAKAAPEVTARRIALSAIIESADAASMAEAIIAEFGSIDAWKAWLKEFKTSPKSVPDLDEHVERVRNNDERMFTGAREVTAMTKQDDEGYQPWVDELIEDHIRDTGGSMVDSPRVRREEDMRRGRPPGSWSTEAMIRSAFGEVEAPNEVDTMRQEEPGSEEDFHSYVETPPELSDPNLDRTRQLDREQEAEGLDQDRLVENVEQFEAPDHARNEMSAQDPHFAMLLSAITPVKHHPSQMNEGRAREEHTMARRSSLASRSKTAAKGKHATQHTAEGPQTDGGDQSVNAQSTREPGEEEFISQTPGAESVELGDAAGGISNTESNLVARMQHTQQQLLRDAARWQEMQRAKSANTKAAARQSIFASKVNFLEQRLGRRLTEAERRKVAETVDTGVPETAQTVNPPLSGTDDQSLKGDNFQPADPNSGVQSTQPKDASVKDPSQQIFAAFDGWLSAGTGQRVASLASRNPRYVLAQAARFASHHNFHPDAFMPTLGAVLRQASSQRTAVDLDVAAPGGRTDVEAPVSNTTDAEAQASQFPVPAFGGNAGDNLADPDLSTDTVVWAPGEGKKEGGFQRASTAAAVEAADLFVESGLRPKEDRYNLIAMHENMRAGQVADRISMCRAFLAVRGHDARRFAAAQRRVTSGVSRGTGLPALPAGFTSGQTRVASAGNRMASVLEDRTTDGLLFI